MFNYIVCILIIHCNLFSKHHGIISVFLMVEKTTGVYVYDFDWVLVFKIGRTSNQRTANWAQQEVSYLKNPLLGLLQQLQGKLFNESGGISENVC